MIIMSLGCRAKISTKMDVPLTWLQTTVRGMRVIIPLMGEGK